MIKGEKIMELSKESKLLMLQMKPIINFFGWIVLILTMIATSKQDMSLIVGFLFIILVRGLYQVIAIGALSIVISKKEKQLQKM